MMDAQEEAMRCREIMKGKRSKRPRLLSPLTLAMPSTSGETSAGSTANSTEFTGSSTEEEEDMANCLILLAQGHTRKPSAPQTKSVPTAGSGSLYECKTCNRSFPSFQALGGHRASHKKPKPKNEENKLVTFFEQQNYHHPHELLDNMSTTLSLQLANKGSCSDHENQRKLSNKVHECSICGAEFSSGQALGGHMRRHRTNTVAHGEWSEAKKPRNVLQLDLNLPAPPEDDHHHRRVESRFSYTAKEQVIVFSASSLVDCHY